MSYRVRIESFEGPFDLLLYLVSRQKVSIGSISLSEITDQYLAEVQRMRNVDLDVASDFLLVASTLLEIKAASLLPHEEAEDVPEEYEEMRKPLFSPRQRIRRRRFLPLSSCRTCRPRNRAAIR